MIATVAAGLIVPVVIEIGGWPALVALLAPVALLIGVIVWLRRTPGADESVARKPATEPLRAIPSADALPPPEEPVDWAGRIKDAQAADDRTALPALYLSLARSEIGQGRHEAAAEHLRSCVRAAAKSRNAAVQAEARLELAELARDAGDLTTACEHWQMARSLFHELKGQAGLVETERLMQKHGCPTDWVLNDF